MKLDDATVGLQIWDTAGSERFLSIGTSFYKGSDCCAITFDVTQASTFRNIDTWHDEFMRHCGSGNKEIVPFVLIGNKADLKDQRKVEMKEIQQWCQAHENAPYFETSAKSGIKVGEMFEQIGLLAIQYRKKAAYIKTCITFL